MGGDGAMGRRRRSDARIAGRPAVRGIALVVVLWTLLLLSLIAAGFMAVTRTEVHLARNAVANARAEALADAGVYRGIQVLLAADTGVVFGEKLEQVLEGRPGLRQALASRPEVQARLLERPRPADDWRFDGTAYDWAFDGAEVRISIQDEGGKIDLNAAPDELLRGLYRSVGLDDDTTAAMVDAIADFRDPDDLRRLHGAEDAEYAAAGLPHGAKDAPFATLDELRQVLGMTRGLYDSVVPALTVYSEAETIDPRTAPRAALLALPDTTAEQVDELLKLRAEVGEDGLPGLLAAEDYLAPSTAQTYTVRAEARTETAAIFVREAVVGVTVEAQRPFVLRAWRRGSEPVTEAPADVAPQRGN